MLCLITMPLTLVEILYMTWQVRDYLEHIYINIITHADWLNEERLDSKRYQSEREREIGRERERLYAVFVSVSTFRACTHFLLAHTLFTSLPLFLFPGTMLSLSLFLSLSLPLSLSFSISLALSRQACFMLARVSTLHRSQREGERKGEGERKREGEREWERGSERERERCRICPEMLFLFLKGMTGAMVPFSYLVIKYLCITCVPAQTLDYNIAQRFRSKENKL